MKRQVITTRDGSHSIAIDEWSVFYHSIHGALQESLHIYIHSGFDYIAESGRKQIRIFELGFGTGLNAFLTAIESEKRNIKTSYTSVEQYPITEKEADSLNYPEQLGHHDLFRQLHHAEWNKEVKIAEEFTLYKIQSSIQDFTGNSEFDLVYFDAFAPSAQPDLWTEEVFRKMYNMLAEDGVLVTYCSKSIVRRAMQAAGFTVNKVPGPWGKREILRAIKTSTVAAS